MLSDHPLGWTPPADRTHERRYLLTEDALPTTPTPLWLGINWYSAFDDPVRDEHGHYWIARNGKLGRLRGGHSIPAKPRGGGDQVAYWDFYDQGAEGACVGFAGSRIYSWRYGQLFFARWLWDIAKGLDVWPDTNAGDENGTSVKAGFDVVRDRGHVRWSNAYAVKQGDVAWRDSLSPDAAIRIQANLWVSNVDDALHVLGYGGLDYVDLVNSWGRSYPHLVRMPASVLERLISEEAEVGVPIF